MANFDLTSWLRNALLRSNDGAARRRKTQLLVLEQLEDRTVPSYTLIDLASFTGANGSNPIYGSLVQDARGNLFGTTVYGVAGGYGTVFKITRGGTVSLSTLASFSNANGGGTSGDVAGPSGSLVEDPSGNLFGTTIGGGASGEGTVFEVANDSGVVTTLASFNGANGAFPYDGSLVEDASGNLFGTAQGGGANGYGTVFEVANGSGVVTTLASFNGANGWAPYGGLVEEGGGNLFGTTIEGGANGEGTVFEVAKGSGTISTVVSFNNDNGTNPGNGEGPYGPLVEDSSGDLFGTTADGGTSGVGTVFEVTGIGTGTSSLITLASFNNADGAYPHGPVVEDASGNLFGTTELGGANGDGTVFEVAKGSGAINTLVSFNGANGADPFGGLVEDSSGDLFGNTEEGGTNGDGTVFEVSQPQGVAPISFNNLNSPIINYGTATTTISGKLQVKGGRQAFPVGETVQVRLNGVIQNATLDTNGSFSTTFDTGTLDVNGSPYNISFSYPGDANLNEATDNSSLTVQQARPTFSGLSAPTITVGTTSTIVSGTLEGNASGQNVPAGETVKVTLNGVTQAGTLDGGDNFSTAFATGTLGVSSSPYSIAFIYGGDTNFDGAMGRSILTVNSVGVGSHAPSVTSISPVAGPVSGGTLVAITGTSLGTQPTAIVDFGTTQAEIISDTSNKILVVSPAGSAGTVNVRVTTSGGTSPITSADRFTYVTPLAIGNLTQSQWIATKAGFVATLTISNGAGPFTLTSASGLPPGLHAVINGSTITVTGTPSVAGTFNCRVTIKNSSGATGTTAFAIIINPPLAINPLSLATFIPGRNYAQTITATGGTGAKTFSLSGSLPPGISFNPKSGVISGIPIISSSPSYSVTVTVTDSVGATARITYRLNKFGRLG